MNGESEAPAESCDSCPLARREFLKTATSMAAMAFVGFHGVAQDKSYPIPAADGTQVDKSNETIITRWQGKLYVFGLACPHQNTALRWSDKKLEFECPKHHSRFTPDGTYVKDSGRATRSLDRFDVRKEGNNVVVNLDKLYQEDENAAAWQAAFIPV